MGKSSNYSIIDSSSKFAPLKTLLSFLFLPFLAHQQLHYIPVAVATALATPKEEQSVFPGTATHPIPKWELEVKTGSNPLLLINVE